MKAKRFALQNKRQVGQEAEKGWDRKSPGKVSPGHTISVMGLAARKLIGLRFVCLPRQLVRSEAGGKAGLSSIIMACMWDLWVKHILTEFELELNE